MTKEDEGQGKISLMISALLSLIVAVLNIKSKHYFYGITMLIVFVLVSIEVLRKFKNRHST
ncbi:hypothetical protein [Clostridium ganghwense]|uniref:Uncharacterized protein n=1 Tax=Clostridium ganghwense TaxID=312089 RepID=A0ABT4CJZ0_9CLOT|nr:hypothetical protein [Clostridium ganghwense]MCY6369370.1 hypothetical protein [Clostridium ganghwense]